MHALLLFHAEAAAFIAPRAQVALHLFADSAILQLNLVAEAHPGCGRLASQDALRRVPIEDGQRLRPTICQVREKIFSLSTESQPGSTQRCEGKVQERSMAASTLRPAEMN